MIQNSWSCTESDINGISGNVSMRIDPDSNKLGAHGGIG